MLTQKPLKGTSQPTLIAPNRPLNLHQEKITGGVIEEGGRRWYRIERVDRMEPFLMSMASDADHWLFVLSSGGITAGRGNPDRALFPYYTQDKIRDMEGSTGSRTTILVEDREGRDICWEPFTERSRRDPAVERNLQKNELGNHIILEEIHRELMLKIRLSWRPSGRFGFVRRVDLQNTGRGAVELKLLDGLQNLLPCGLSQRFQNEFSNLADAYKQAEIEPRSKMGLYHLSSVPTDLSVPMESLQANVVWQTGLRECRYLLSNTQTGDFESGLEAESETCSRGIRSAYLTISRQILKPGETTRWYTCADVCKDVVRVGSLVRDLLDSNGLETEIEEDCSRTEDNLMTLLGEADGLQCTAKPKRALRHMSSTLFNLMRGGALVTGYNLPVADLLGTVAHFNRAAAQRLEQTLGDLKALNCLDPWDSAHPMHAAGKDALRLAREYLPLTFSRRHGDPSRPWNRFNIEVREADGSPKFHYEGNWRDIFQNWESLFHAYPEYLEAGICRFLNASTADGYNPYRLTKKGYEWEILEPGDAWANIGYWGDHQIIYLLRLLEASACFHPGFLNDRLNEEAFVYAEVPYRIKPYGRILEDPRSTIVYDESWAEQIKARVDRMGADGKLMPDQEDSVLYVSLLEKLLAPLLAKLANFIPAGGIWMNTQRPEWNDANNALVGYGISVVTLGYVARYLRFLIETFGRDLSGATFTLSTEINTLLESQSRAFADPPGDLNPEERFAFMKTLGEPASHYREGLYANGLCGEKTRVPGTLIRDYLAAALGHVDYCLRDNQREDHLWHSYNLLKLEGEAAHVGRLFVMLEGQVSVLSSGILKTEESLQLIRSLRQSPLYRIDQDSYILYPNRHLPSFLDKNLIDAGDVRKIELLSLLDQVGDHSIVTPCQDGRFAFNGEFHNKGDLRAALDKLKDKESLQERVGRDGPAVIELFETVFKHHSFTGRSGTFFAYEGLGSIYWHMVSKLVLAVLEQVPEKDSETTPDQKQEWLDHFRHFRDGLGVDKNPGHYGAIPTDAYSHTPERAGAQQPGMTGQVKEDILVRLAELGVAIRDGCLCFRTDLVGGEEFLDSPGTLSLPDGKGGFTDLEVPKGAMAYTFCGLPILFHSGKTDPGIHLTLADGSIVDFPENVVPADLSRKIFRRTGEIIRIDVEFPLQ